MKHVVSINLFMSSFVLASFAGAPALSSSTTAPAKTPSMATPSKAQLDQQAERDADMVAKEALVSLSEQKAIEALERILAKKKNAPEEPDMLERLSELYLKQAKSVRFFALNKTGDKTMSMMPPVIKEKAALRPLKKAVECFQAIQSRHPKYPNADRIHFHKALTLAQMGLFKPSTTEVEQLLARFPNSEWRSDAHLLIGEVLYDSQSYSKALNHFNQAAASEKPKISQYARYKAAWTLYNMERNEDAIAALTALVKSVDPDKSEGFALRNESLRDLALYMTETRASSEAFAFFRSFASEAETASVLFRMANIYRSHSKPKDARLLATEYLAKGSSDEGKIQFRLLLAKDAKETRQSAVQVEHLKAAFDLCMIQPEDNEVCKVDLRVQMGEAAEDAWKAWEKTKTPAYLKMAKDILEIEIQRNPDPRPKTLEAYAELLFQSEDFENAARIYRDLIVKVKDPAEKEKARYGSLVSLDRWMDKDKNAILAREFFKEEVAVHLKAYPKTASRNELLLRWANIQFLDRDFAKSEANLRLVLTSDSKARIPAENLLLETLKEQQKNVELKKMLAQFIDKAATPDRKAELSRMNAQMELETLESTVPAKADGKSAATADQSKKLKDYLAFLKTYQSDEKITEPVYWKTLALALTMSEDKVAFDLLQPRVGKSPDPRVWDGIKQILVRHDSIPAEKSPAAAVLYETSLKLVGEKERPKILWSYREHLIKANDRSSRIEQLESEILKSGVEPEKSLIQVTRLEKDFAAGRLEKVFSETRSLVAASKPPVVRARARLLQARVLESELKAQGLKSSLSRLQLVVGMKLEKLSKAQEAFMSALQLSSGVASDPLTAKDARDGMKRCFQHSIESLRQVEIKDDLTPQEKKALDDQIQNLVAPLENQLKELLASDEVKS